MEDQSYKNPAEKKTNGLVELENYLWAMEGNVLTPIEIERILKFVQEISS